MLAPTPSSPHSSFHLPELENILDGLLSTRFGPKLERALERRPNPCKVVIRKALAQGVANPGRQHRRLACKPLQRLIEQRQRSHGVSRLDGGYLHCEQTTVNGRST